MRTVSLLLALCAAWGASAFAPSARGLAQNTRRSRQQRTTLSMKVGLYFSTMSGNTERIAGYIADATGLEATSVDDVGADALAGDDAVIIGAPTWNTGADEQRSGTSMDQWLYDTLPGVDMSGKKVAIFGCGDSAGYSGNFCDAMGEIADCFEKRGATLVGPWSQDGYEHYESKVRKLRDPDSSACALVAPAVRFHRKTRRRFPCAEPCLPTLRSGCARRPFRWSRVRRAEPVRSFRGARSRLGCTIARRGHAHLRCAKQAGKKGESTFQRAKQRRRHLSYYGEAIGMYGNLFGGASF